VIAVLLASGAFAQPKTLPQFSTVSIEPANRDGEAATSISAGLTGTVHIRNAALRDCIAWAYDLPPYLIFENDQLFPNRYDIDAKTPVGISANRYREMLQSLLAGRFRLSVHREIKATPGYALVAAGHGLKIHPVQKTGAARFRSGRDSLSGENVSLKELAGRLSLLTGRPVSDAASTPGAFTFKLTWRQPRLKQRSPQPAKNSALNAFMTSLEEQLGVKLISLDTSLEMLVVDHAERPALGPGKLTK
jgi:uncharacterized protein (TIGR03435 family)